MSKKSGGSKVLVVLLAFLAIGVLSLNTNNKSAVSKSTSTGGTGASDTRAASRSQSERSSQVSDYVRQAGYYPDTSKDTGPVRCDVCNPF